MFQDIQKEFRELDRIYFSKTTEEMAKKNTNQSNAQRRRESVTVPCEKHDSTLETKHKV